MVSLLDVNTLVALAWPNHVHHEPAHRWFAEHHTHGWATCPLTESGFVRVSSSPLATPEARRPGEAVLLLRKIVELPHHTFWTDAVSLARSEEIRLETITGHRQVTDLHLLLLVIANGGRLVTFDRGVEQLLPSGVGSEALVVL